MFSFRMKVYAIGATSIMDDYISTVHLDPFLKCDGSSLHIVIKSDQIDKVDAILYFNR
jgi:hypothetical protein